MIRKWLAAAFCLWLLFPAAAGAEDEEDLSVEEIVEYVLLDEDDVEIPIEEEPVSEPEVEVTVNEDRQLFIDRIREMIG